MREGLILPLLAMASLVGCTDSAPPIIPQELSGPGVANRSDLATVQLDGRPFELWEGRERAVCTVLVFTRTDCPIANRYAPTLRSLCEHYQPAGVDFFLVYVDPDEDSEDIHRHMQEYQYTCPGLHDPSHRLVAECGATVTPEAVVFDSQRKMVYRGRIDDLYADFGRSRNEASTHELADALEAVVSKRPVAQTYTKAVGCYISDLK
jgi:hypothetical protein